MLLKWSDLEMTGVTTVSEEQRRRAGYVRRGRCFWSEILRCAQDDNRAGIPCEAGADVSGGYYRYELDHPPDEENWPEPITPRPGPPDKALALLKRSNEY